MSKTQIKVIQKAPTWEIKQLKWKSYIEIFNLKPHIEKVPYMNKSYVINMNDWKILSNEPINNYLYIISSFSVSVSYNNSQHENSNDYLN